MKRTVYLDKQGQVDLMRYLQRLQRMRGKVVVIRHKILAKKLDVSESTVRRRVNEMVESGHIIRTHIKRPTRGGYLCVYRVETGIIYRRSSFLRQARNKIEQVIEDNKRNGDGGYGGSSAAGSKGSKNNKDNHNPPVDKHRMSDLLEVARAAGIDDHQRGFLRLAALKYGVTRAWEALVIAFERGYALPDLVRVTWGILKRQEGVT